MNPYKNFDWKNVGLDFGNWEEEKIWALKLPVEEISISELLWHFDVPFWTNDGRLLLGMLFVVSREVRMREIKLNRRIPHIQLIYMRTRETGLS